MYGDISRWSFRPERHFSSVLFQQGRVSLDADANELTAILRHMQRTLTRDLIGPFGGPEDNAAFEVLPDPAGGGGGFDDIRFGTGRYYVDGWLVENADTPAERAELLQLGEAEGGVPFVRLGSQPFADLELQPNDSRLDPPFLLYLRVWERHVTSIEEPLLREIALGRTGPDTTTRTQIAWQVLVTNEDAIVGLVSDTDSDEVIKNTFLQQWPGVVAGWQPAARGLMRAQAKSGDGQDTQPCVQSPESRFRGAENQLYRVEIHNSGAAGAGATYKWSRDNATVTFPIRERAGKTVAVETLGRDERRGLDIGDWVELVDDRSGREVLGPGEQPENLHRVAEIDPYDRTVTLRDLPQTDVGEDPARHPLLRRWDSNARPIADAIDPRWDDLEDGIQIQFAAAPAANFRRGDFWLVPARVETGDVFDWPREPTAVGQDERPRALPPAGIDEAFAPLAYFRGTATAATQPVDLRCLFPSLCQ